MKKQLDKEGFRTQNGKPLTKSNYHAMLTNLLYYSMMRWNNELYKGIHQPLIDKQLFDRVQDMLRRTKNGELIPVYAKHDLTYRGTLQCDECGCKVTGEEKTKTNKGNGKIHRWVYYHCTHFRSCEQKGCTKEEDIDDDIIAVFNSLDLGPNTTEWLKNKLKESHQDEIEFREKAVNDLNLRLQQVQKRLDAAYDDKLDGIIDTKTYARKKTQFIAEQGDLEQLIKQHRKADQIYTDLGCLVLDVVHRAGEIYEVRKPDQKRYLINFVFSNLSLRDKKVQHSFRLIFEALSKYKKDQNWFRGLYATCEKYLHASAINFLS